MQCDGGCNEPFAMCGTCELCGDHKILGWNETYGYLCDSCESEHPHDPKTCPLCKRL